MTDWKHDALAIDLAAHLRGYARPAMVWLDMQLGPAGSPRPDVYTMEHTYTALRAMAYEIKVSRSDFQRDVQAGKYLSYLKFAGAVVFACPKGMVKRDEIPAGCGLIERGPETWRWARKPTINNLQTLPRDAWMKLVMDGCSREVGTLTSQVRVKLASEYLQQQTARKLMGDELGQLYADRDRARMHLKHQIQQDQAAASVLEDARRKRAQADLDAANAARDSVRSEIKRWCRELGLDESVNAWEIRQQLESLRPEHDKRALQQAAESLRWNAGRLNKQADELASRIAAGEQ